MLLSYDKIVIFNELLDSEVPEDPHLSKELVRYFPKALQERFAGDMENHRLRREIIATAVTNSMVNRMGATFLQRMQEDTGESAAQIAKAYSVSREVLDARSFWSAIDDLDLKVPESAQVEALTALWHLQRNMTRWLLNRPGDILVITSMVERYAKPLQALRQALPKILPASSRALLKEDQAAWQQTGFPAELALSMACVPYLTYALDIVEVALERDLPVADVGLVYFALSDALHTTWLMSCVEKLPVDGRWHAQARGVLRDELQSQQRALVGTVLARPRPARTRPSWCASGWPATMRRCATRRRCSTTCATCAAWTSRPSRSQSAASRNWLPPTPASCVCPARSSCSSSRHGGAGEGGFCGRSSVRRVLPTDARPAGHPWPASAETPFPRHRRPSPSRDGRANRRAHRCARMQLPIHEPPNRFSPTKKRRPGALRSCELGGAAAPLAPRREGVGGEGVIAGGRPWMACRSVFGWQDAAYRTTDQREPLPAGGFTPRPAAATRSPPSSNPDVICTA